MDWKKHVTKSFKGKPGFPMVEVLWLDARALAVDWEEEITNSPMPTTTVGYLVAQSNESITLVSIVNEFHVGHGVVIPRGCITRVIDLERNTEAGTS